MVHYLVPNNVYTVSTINSVYTISQVFHKPYICKSVISGMKDETSTTKAGRPLLYEEPLERYLVTLTPTQAKHLEDIGEENRSEGIRRLLQWHEGIIEKP